MSVLDSLQTRAAASPARIVLSEGHDPRIVAAAVSAVEAGIATIVLVGPTGEITKQLSNAEAHQAMPSALKTPSHRL